MMTPDLVIDLGRQALEVTLLIALPMLGAALVAGLVISVVQAATQVNDMTLSFIPKLLALVAVLVLAGPWMLQLLVAYVERLYTSIPAIVG